MTQCNETYIFDYLMNYESINELRVLAFVQFLQISSDDEDQHYNIQDFSNGHFLCGLRECFQKNINEIFYLGALGKPSLP